ncbi:unnamed protein product [Mesocestoides corti]|uniref:Uncharacterized protein n=1 Tax=Mesocestoides corti TaxID=53468 RepID=A0A3P6HA67_MESCO|nr:unnamed protein product [Mesocestoides corti]
MLHRHASVLITRNPLDNDRPIGFMLWPCLCGGVAQVMLMPTDLNPHGRRRYEVASAPNGLTRCISDYGYDARTGHVPWMMSALQRGVQDRPRVITG